MAIHQWLLIFLFALSTISISVFSEVFVSIDCGATDFYTDENSIVWTGDDTLIENGDSQVVQSSNSLSRVLDTLRVFTTRKKNCYSVDAEKGGKVLVRASFHYGNYDRMSNPPTFDLHFDGNFWVTVNTSQSYFYEVIYVAKTDVVSVCLAQTRPNEFPFISALEVRSVDTEMYGHIDSNYALFLNTRVGYALNETIRFPDDKYDRIWSPAVIGSGLVNVTNDALLVDVNVLDNPPQGVFRNAIMTPNTSQIITLGLGITEYPTRYPVYINWYFSEVKETNATEDRSFRIFKDGRPFSLPIKPLYGSVIEYYVSNQTITPDTNFTLNSLGDATLPPVINALEVFSVSDALTDGTNNNDVEGLSSLKTAFNVLEEWGGDPCLPSPYSWEWITCNDDPTPRVTSLDLNSFGLDGLLPDLSNMDALEKIDLRNNSLNGPVPSFFGTMPNLKQLNLADNHFSGPIPSSLSRNTNLTLVVTGNPSLCTSNDRSCRVSTSGSTSTRSKKKNNKLPIILGTTIPVFLIFWAIVGVFVILRQRQKAVALPQAGIALSGTKDNEVVGESEVNTNGQFYGSPSPLLTNIRSDQTTNNQNGQN